MGWKLETAAGVDRVTEGSDVLGESPVWCTREQRLYWVDIRAPALHALDPATGHRLQWTLPDLCGAVALAQGRRVLLAMRTGICTFDLDARAPTPLVQPEPESLGNRLNESRCDRRGRLWTGSMRDYG